MRRDHVKAQPASQQFATVDEKLDVLTKDSHKMSFDQDCLKLTRDVAQFQRLDVDLEQRFIHWMLLFWSSAMHPTKNCARIGSSVHLHYLACSLLQSCVSVFCMEMG